MKNANEKLNGQFVTINDLSELPRNVEFYAASKKDGQNIVLGQWLSKGNSVVDFNDAIESHGKLVLVWANEKLFEYDALDEINTEFFVEGKEDGWYDCQGNHVYSFDALPRSISEFLEKGDTSHYYDVTSYGIVAKWVDESCTIIFTDGKFEKEMKADTEDEANH